jgi:hypothetical protein
MHSEKIYGKIKRLTEEVKILRRPFVFRGFDYQDKILTDSENIKRMLESRYEMSMDYCLSRTGQMVQDDQHIEEAYRMIY